MDRASILGDAIEYLKELLQRINDLHNELEATPAAPPPSFHPLTPTPPTLPCRVKDELGQISLPNPKGQPATVSSLIMLLGWDRGRGWDFGFGLLGCFILKRSAL